MHAPSVPTTAQAHHSAAHLGGPVRVHERAAAAKHQLKQLVRRKGQLRVDDGDVQQRRQGEGRRGGAFTAAAAVVSLLLLLLLKPLLLLLGNGR